MSLCVQDVKSCISVVLYTIQVISKQLHRNKEKKLFIKYETNSVYETKSKFI